MIKFNDPDFSDQRALVEPLTLEEEQQAILYLNDCIARNPAQHAGDQDLVQRLVWNYENMCHYRSYTQDLGREMGLLEDFPKDFFDADAPATEITPEQPE